MPLPPDNLNTTPTVPLDTQARVRLGQLAKDFDQALQQGYVETNVLVRALELVKQLLGPAGLAIGV